MGAEYSRSGIEIGEYTATGQTGDPVGQTRPSATGHRPSNNWNGTPGRKYSAGAKSDTNDIVADDSDLDVRRSSSEMLHSSDRAGAEIKRIVAEYFGPRGGALRPRSAIDNQRSCTGIRRLFTMGLEQGDDPVEFNHIQVCRRAKVIQIREPEKPSEQLLWDFG